MSEATDILLVDDQARNLDALEAVLASPDYRLVRAQSANEALLALLTYDFAVIVLDIRMPEIDGYELAQMIKQRKRTSICRSFS
ncbi:MAG: response regulator [Candidatus Binatia bacterium]